MKKKFSNQICFLLSFVWFDIVVVVVQHHRQTCAKTNLKIHFHSSARQTGLLVLCFYLKEQLTDSLFCRITLRAKVNFISGTTLIDRSTFQSFPIGAFPSHHVNFSHISQFPSADESQSASSRDLNLVPLQPSQIDPRPTAALDEESHLNPVFAEQNFFPSFFRGTQQPPPARPFSSRHVTGSSSRYLSSENAFDESILGSGDFTVMRGGTFYPDGEGRRRPSHDYFGSSSSSFHESSNSGRPFALPLESPQYSDDPFANFRDFADITAGIDSDFSHFVVVYANKNSTKTAKHEPKNIFEQLEMIDEEKRNEKLNNQKAEMPDKPTKITKLSKFKSKLATTKLTKVLRKPQFSKKSWESSSADLIDPLVAES